MIKSPHSEGLNISGDRQRTSTAMMGSLNPDLHISSGATAGPKERPHYRFASAHVPWGAVALGGILCAVASVSVTKERCTRRLYPDVSRLPVLYCGPQAPPSV